MTVTAVFENFMEMQEFAKAILGTEPKPMQAAQPKQASQPAAVPAITAQAPVMPQQAAPVQQTGQIPQAAPAQVPTTQAAYKQDDLARAAMMLMDSGKQDALLQLLAKFGVDSLPSLSPEQYGAFATELRGLGARI